MLACTASALGFIAATPALAQVAALEEVVVTARKREESLQTVPVAVTVQTGAELERQRITQPVDMGRVVPSLRIINSSSSSNSASIILRGQASTDTLVGISQPVGLYEDGVNIPHPFGANNAFFDLQRVEVLKGPQGTLYGRNTTAGAVNVITRDADYAGLHGFMEGEVGNFNNWRVGAAVNVPIVDEVLAARLAVMHWTRDGFGKSLTTGQRFGDDKDDHLARLSIRFDPSPSLSVKLKGEYTEASHNGALLQNISISPVPALANSAYLSTAVWSNPAVYRPIVRDAQTPGSPTQAASLAQAVAVGRALLAPCIGADPYTNCTGTLLNDKLRTWHLVLDVSWDITDKIRLRSITGGHHFDNWKTNDLDATQSQLLETGYGIGGTILAVNGGDFFYPLNRGFELKDDQASTQWSQEFNLSGELFGDRLSWLVGAFASEDKARGAQNNAFQADLAAASGRDPGLGSFDTIGGNNRTWAVFSQNDIKLTDKISVTLGGRYTVERLENDLASWTYNFQTGRFTCTGAAQNPAGGFTTSPFAPADQNSPDTCAYGGVLSEGPDQAFSRAKFDGFTYLASVNYQITPNKLIYAKLAKGFRGGAFGRARDLISEPEYAKDYEIGFKGDWFDSRLRTNIALYRTNYTNKQVSIQLCNLTGQPPVNGTCPLGSGFTTVVRNAARARIEGIEGEITFRPFSGLTLNASASAIDAVYVDWPNAVSGEGAPLGNGKGLPISLGSYGTPNWQGDFNARYEFEAGPGIVGLVLDYAIVGRTPVSPANNQAQVPDALEYKIQGAQGLLNARLEYAIPDRGLELSAWATNLTDKTTGYMGISANFTAGIGHRVMNPPRMYGVTIKKRFGSE